MRRKKHRWINGTKGMISLLLAMLLLPFYSLAAVLVESLRYQSTVKAMDELLGTSSISVLANYDKYLQERFGLLAVSQKGGDDGLADSLVAYLNKNKLTDAAGIDLSSVSATGMYPLADTRVLRRQITEYGQILVPIRATTDVLQFDQIIKKIEDATHLNSIFSAITSGAKTVGSIAEDYKVVDEAKKTAKVVQKDAEAYDDRFNKWSEAVTALTDHLGTYCPSQDEDPDGYREWKDTRDNLEEAADKAKKDYAAAISKLIGSLGSLDTKAKAVIRANAKIANQIGKDIDDIAKEELQISDDINKAVKAGIDDYDRRVNQASRALSNSRIETAVRELTDEQNKVNGFKTENLTAASNAPETENYHTVDVAGVANVDSLEQIISESQADIQKTGIVDTISSLFAGVNSLLALNTFYDPALSCKFSKDIYGENGSLLPSRRERGSGPYALADSNEADEQRSIQFLQEIDSDFDADDPYHQNGDFGTDIITMIMEDLSRLMNDVEKLKNTPLEETDEETGESSDESWFAVLWDACKTAGDMAMHCGQFVEQIGLRMQMLEIEKNYEKLLINGYMAYNLPNRTNYYDAMGKTLSGYSFSNIPFGTARGGEFYDLPTSASRLAALVDVIRYGGGTDSVTLAGAELEYILWGFNSEVADQVMQFFTLFVFRMLVDLQILMNPEIQGIIAGSNVASPLVALLYISLEALADTVLLVNGKEAPFVKLKPYTTVGGMTELAKNLVSIPSLQKGTTTNKGTTANNGTGGNNNSTDTEKISLKKEPTISLEKDTPGGEKINLQKEEQKVQDKKNYLAYNYTEHSLLLMMLFGSEEKYLSRLTDLIQSESLAYGELNASVSDRVAGTPVEFDVDNSYTVVRAAASGSLKSLLPIPGLPGETLLTTNRVTYRGY